MALHVNVYELDRVYGGPEEGGWWFTTGTLVKSKRARTRANAEAIEARLMEKFPRGDGLSNCGSVLYHGGDFTVMIENRKGKDFPEFYPHYE